MRLPCTLLYVVDGRAVIRNTTAFCKLKIPYVSDFSGIRQQSLTPGEDFDIEYRSEADTSPFKALRIFDAVDGITACGDRRLRLSVGVELPIQTSGTIREDPLVHVADGVTSVLTWRGLKVQHWQTNPLLVCLCEHEFFHASNENDVPCAYPGNYTIHAGYIQVRGE